MPAADLVIRNGHIVNADGACSADVGISGETIAQLGGEMQGERELDADGLLVLPGGVDAHVHLSAPPGEREGAVWVDDFTSGSAAALAGGITTVGNMSFPAAGETPMGTLRREEGVAEVQAIADVFLHPVLHDITPDVLAEIPRLPAVGCTSMKVFMIGGEFDAQVEAYVQAIALAGASGLITLIHCEDHALIQAARNRLIQEGRTALRYYPELAPVITEVAATQRAVAIAEATGAPIYIVHLSSARALEVCVAAQERGLQVYVETRPLYLHLTSERFEEEEAGKYVGQPPLREQSDVDALWAGLRQGTIHTVCSDHAPYALADKLDPAHTVARLRAGVENLQLLRPMLFSEGVRTGRVSLSRFVQVTATNATRLFGLERKGRIAPGYDADLVLFDPNLTRTVDNSMLKSNADYSVYEGWEITGWPVMTISRGEIVYQDDEVTGAPGRGRIVRRTSPHML